MRRQWHGADTGFTLIELLVTMFVVAGALLALLALQVRAQQTVALARERQQATALANQAMEKVRGHASNSVGAAEIVSGRKPQLPDANVIGTCATACNFQPSFATLGPEPIRFPVVPSTVAVLGTTTDPVGSTTYTTRLYVTNPTAGNRSADVTAVTSWNSRQASNRPHQVAVRTTVFVPGA